MQDRQGDAEVRDGQGGMGREAEKMSAPGEWLGRIHTKKKTMKITMFCHQVHCTWGLDMGVTGPFPLPVDTLQPQPASDILD